MKIDMKNKRRLFGIIPIFIFLIGCFAQQVNSPEVNKSKEIAVENQRSGLKKFATCVCIHDVYPNFEEGKLDGSASAYLQLTDYDVFVYDSTRTFVRNWVKNHKYFSFNNFTLGLKKCLDFNASMELDSFVRKFDTYIDE